MRSSSVLMLSGHSLVLGALPSLTSSSSRGVAPVTVASSSSSPFPFGTLGTLVPLLTPRRFRLELGATLKFLTLGLMGKRELPQVPLWEADDSVEGERPPSRGPGCSASLPGKTRGILSSSHVCVSDPQIELVDSAFAFEARAVPRLAVHDETTLGGVHHPVALVASGAH